MLGFRSAFQSPNIFSDEIPPQRCRPFHYFTSLHLLSESIFNAFIIFHVKYKFSQIVIYGLLKLLIQAYKINSSTVRLQKAFLTGH